MLNPGKAILTPHYDTTLDFLAFLFIILSAKRSRHGLNIPTVLGTIAQDATRYFLVIFTSHFILVMTLNLGRVSAIVPPDYSQ